ESMPPLPKPIAPQTLARLNTDPFSYEAHKVQIDSQNRLIAYLGPGVSITAASFSLSPGLSITSLSGSFKRGKFVVTIGQGVPASPSILLIFPKGEFSGTPFATVAKSAGTGLLGFNYAEAANGLTITINGVPAIGTTYGFNYALQD